MSFSESKPEEEFSVEELVKLRKEHREIEEETKRLNNYLNQNIFSVLDSTTSDKAAEDGGLGELFKTEENSFNFFKKLSKSGIFEFNFPLLEVNNLTKYYGNKTLPTLINVSLKLYCGDFHIVVGAYSSGKTTLFNCISGKEEYEGEILFSALNYQGNMEKILKVCGFVHYEHDFDLFSTLEEVVSTKLQLLGMDEYSIEKYLELKLKIFKLDDKRDSLIVDLSLIEIRKVQLLIALAYNAPIIVLDQPILGLQYSEKIELLELLCKFKSEDRSILVFSHEIAEFSDFCSSCTILSEGKVYYCGPVDKLLLEKKNKYSITTSDNEGCMEILDKYSEKFYMNELKRSILCSFDGSLNLLLFQRECSKKNIILFEMKKVSLELEDIYPILSDIGNKSTKIEINRERYFST